VAKANPFAKKAPAGKGKPNPFAKKAPAGKPAAKPFPFKHGGKAKKDMC
jgi:hypothetical protein